jgi:hypothetical protein
MFMRVCSIGTRRGTDNRRAVPPATAILAQSAAPSVAGSVKLNVAPAPGALSAQMRPW